MDPLPQALVNMLRNQCPDLEELIIGSFKFGRDPYRKFNAVSLTGFHWPKLRTLRLDHAGFYDTFALIDKVSSSELREGHQREISQASHFLASHPTLQNVAIVPEGSIIPSSGTPLISIRGFPRRSVYEDHLRFLLELDLSSSPIGNIPGSFIWEMHRYLMCCSSLVTLSIGIDDSRDAHDPTTEGVIDHVRAIAGILKSCPQLLHLRLRYITSSTSKFPIVSSYYRPGLSCYLALTLRSQTDICQALNGSNLKSLEFTRNNASNNYKETMSVAAQLAHQNPDLESITLQILATRTLGTIELKPSRVSNSTVFSITRDGSGNPYRMVAHDWCLEPRSKNMIHRKHVYDINARTGPVEGGRVRFRERVSTRARALLGVKTMA